jgi:hypothetical protein
MIKHIAQHFFVKEVPPVCTAELSATAPYRSRCGEVLNVAAVLRILWEGVVLPSKMDCE